jgi:hypothetical protein
VTASHIATALLTPLLAFFLDVVALLIRFDSPGRSSSISNGGYRSGVPSQFKFRSMRTLLLAEADARYGRDDVATTTIASPGWVAPASSYRIDELPQVQ